MTQAIDELLGEVSNVVSASKEQTTASQALAQDVAGKMGAIDQKVDEAKEDYQAFKDNADDRYQLSLSNNNNLSKLDLKHLDPDKFYAVVFYTPQMLELRFRRYVHDDVSNGGILDYFVRFQNWSAGGDFQFAVQEHHYYSNRAFVGKILGAATPYYSAVWLRGGWSYSLFMNGQVGSVPRIIEDDATVVENPYGTKDFYAVPIDALDSTVVANNYIRGA
ncbi:hypothetical protein [Shewanella sp. GutDb-MelDb]|uniref:hypothetical protein n=1 Tax=Shewanella sp. GutDb-MelDb TaxID=2058316 RepID=UPI000C797070|nr:hypothetical protein [Shewanella sp. GutDb-MelDb]PKG57745.1 hypothetical protein CXF82_08200 [Shewanella sp. GutDb-MelDb]